MDWDKLKVFHAAAEAGSARAQHSSVAADLQQRRQEAGQAEQSLHDCQARLANSQFTMLNASAGLAHWYREKETAECQAAELTAQRQVLRQERMRLATLTA